MTAAVSPDRPRRPDRAGGQICPPSPASDTTIFAEAAALIADRRSWTKGGLAEDADGRRLSPTDPRACRWDLLGAVMCAAGIDDWAKTQPYRAVLYRVIGRQGAAAWNDTSDHPAVIAALDAAALLCDRTDRPAQGR